MSYRHALLAVMTFPLAMASFAEDSTAPSSFDPDKNFSVRVGYLKNNADANMIVQRRPLDPVEINLDDLGMDKEQDSFWIAARWRYSERWSLGLTVNRFNDNGRRSTARTFNFDGIEIPAGSDINTSFTADAYIIDFSYAFYQSEYGTAGLGVGAHALDLEASIDARLYIGENELRSADTGDSLIAPVPNLRAFGHWYVGQRGSIRADFGWLSASYDDYEGKLIYAGVAYEYQLTDAFAAGIGYQYTDIDLKHDRGDKGKEEYNISSDGLHLHLAYRF